MFDRTLFKELPLQLIVLFGLVYFGTHLSGLLLQYLVVSFPELGLNASSLGMLTAQIITSIILFILPTLICGWLFSMGNIRDYLSLQLPLKWHWTFVSVALILLAQPFIGLLAYLNDMISFPSFLSGKELLLRSLEDAMEIKMNTMLATDHLGGLLFNLLVVALFAGVAEELFFRGLIQRIAYAAVENKHIAIWLTAMIFSIVHFQFFGFFPRLLLGAFFGYLVYATGSIWCSVIVHAANNAFVVIIHYIEQHNSSVRISHWGEGDSWWIGLVSAVLLVVSVVILKRNRRFGI